MNWLWMNIPLAAVFFTAWAGIPLWMVVKHPDWGPEPASPYRVAELQAVTIPAQGDSGESVDPQPALAGGRSR